MYTDRDDYKGNDIRRDNITRGYTENLKKLKN